MTDIKIGDRVRVTIEAELVGDWENGCVCTNQKFSERYLRNDAVVSVEKLEPPVVVFGPGDVVRDKGSTLTFILTDDGGYTVVETGTHYDSGLFKSTWYERVNLVHAPF